MNWADIALLAIIALSSLVGGLRGLLVEVMSLVVWAVAFWLAFRYGESASGIYVGFVATRSAQLFLGYTTLFIGALAIGGWATWLLGKLIKSTGLSGTDRLLGLMFGAARGAALACIAVLVMGFTPLTQDSWWTSSRLIPKFVPGAEWMREWLPEAVASQVNFELLPPPALAPVEPAIVPPAPTDI